MGTMDGDDLIRAALSRYGSLEVGVAIHDAVKTVHRP